MPTTGTRSRSAVSIASTMCRQPSTPIAPPITVASVQKAMAGLPCTVPRAASTPEVSPGDQQLHRAGVEEPLQAVLGVARVRRRAPGGAACRVVKADLQGLGRQRGRSLRRW